MPLDPADKEWLDERFGAINQRVDHALHGPDGKPHEGIWIRLDRIEQVVRAIGRLTWLAIGAGIAGIIGAFTAHGGGSGTTGGHP